MIKEFERSFCVTLIFLLMAATLIIYTGFRTTSSENDTDSVAAMKGMDSSQTMILDNVEDRIYDPADNAAKQKEFERMARENGCIVVLSQDTDTPESESVVQGVSDILRNYYSLPINDAQQDRIFALCEQYDLPCELVFGVILADSERGDHPGHALTYPNPEIAQWYADEYGISDIDGFEGNITLTVVMLAEYYHRYPDVHTIAMCYELGEKQAIEKRSTGITETEYSRLVALRINTLQLREHS